MSRSRSAGRTPGLSEIEGGSDIIPLTVDQMATLNPLIRTVQSARVGRLLHLAAILSVSCLIFGCGRTSGTSPAEHYKAAVNLWSDSDGDGIPDAAELRSYDDRENFRRWFTGIAEKQFYELSPAWNGEQRDCAGLVRFSMREALRRHDRPWFQRMGSQYEPMAGDVRAYNLENGPLGEKLFRTDFGTFKQSDVQDGKFSEFADGKTLKNHNSTFVSRDRRQAKPGDLLFFYQPWVQKYPYHVMIFIGAARMEGEGAADWVVYHTGSAPEYGGTIKKVRLSVLDHHPDKRWRPVETNPNFLGFYRLKILSD
jgi:uncharacterized protein YfaT (DUF1175 family)